VVDAKVNCDRIGESEARRCLTLLRFLDLEPIHIRDLAALRQSQHGGSLDASPSSSSKESMAPSVRNS